MSNPAWRPEWHQRIPGIRSARTWARAAVYRALRSTLATDDGLSILSGAVDDAGDARLSRTHVSPAPAPYADLGRAGRRSAVNPAVFVTARFRSGSTLLWNLFRHAQGCTAYYEPLNERRWFDPALRGTTTDATHKNVDDYWREYDGLEELGHYYREDWIRRRLFMDETSWDPDLEAYIGTLIARSRGTAVLQFNRVDFRLPWLRRAFPDATIVHLYRHPRDQWCSSLPDPSAFPASAGMRDFEPHDHFYLLVWARDLRHRFPFLEPSASPHPYRVFYFLWRLSYLFGVKYAHYSVSFEDLVGSPASTLQDLFAAAGIAGANLGHLAGLVQPSPHRWMKYADDGWFRGHEEACETVLARYFGWQADAAVAAPGRAAVAASS